jgi:hypothetical protein
MTTKEGRGEYIRRSTSDEKVCLNVHWRMDRSNSYFSSFWS